MFDYLQNAVNYVLTFEQCSKLLFAWHKAALFDVSVTDPFLFGG